MLSANGINPSTDKTYTVRLSHKFRDETIQSSHDMIRIDTKGDDMVIFDTIRYNTDNNCKNTNIHNVHIYANIHNVHILL